MEDNGVITKHNDASYVNDINKVGAHDSKFPGHNDSRLVSNSN